MQKKILITGLLISSLILHSGNPLPESNNKYLEILKEEKDLQNLKADELLRIQILQQANITQLLALEFEIKKAELQEKIHREKMIMLAEEIEANKPWYEKTWDTLAPAITRAVLNFIVSTIAAKIINGGVSCLDKATGDWLVQNGYSKYAVFAGTFIAADSLEKYSEQRHKKIILSDREVLHYNQALSNFKTMRGTDIAKGGIANQVSSLMELTKLGNTGDEYLRRKAGTSDKDSTSCNLLC